MASAEELQRIASEMRGECLAMCVRQINRHVTRIYDAALRPYGVGTAQLNIIIALALAGTQGVRRVKIAKALGLEKSTLTRNIDRMVGHGWITSEADAGGGTRLRLSAEGRRLMERALEGWRAAQQKASAEIQPQLVEALMRVGRASAPRSPRSGTGR